MHFFKDDFPSFSGASFPDLHGNLRGAINHWVFLKKALKKAAISWHWGGGTLRFPLMSLGDLLHITNSRAE